MYKDHPLVLPENCTLSSRVLSLVKHLLHTLFANATTLGYPYMLRYASLDYCALWIPESAISAIWIPQVMLVVLHTPRRNFFALRSLLSQPTAVAVLEVQTESFHT